MSSSIITTESTQNDVLKPIGNLEHQQTPVDKNSTSTAINSSEASFGKERKEVDTSQKYVNEAGESDKYSSTRSSGHINANTSLPAPVSNQKNKLDEGGEEPGEEDFADDSEDDSEDDFPRFEGGEPRGRVVNPYAGSKPPKPTHK